MSKKVMEQRIGRAGLCRRIFVDDPPVLRPKSVTFIYGVSGVGKSTLCEQLITKSEHKELFTYISSGVIAKRLAESGESEIAGQYYNDERALWREMAKAWLAALNDVGRPHVLIDGYLRRPLQVVRVADFMAHEQESATTHPGSINFIYVEQERDEETPQYMGVTAARVLLCEAKQHENEINNFSMGLRSRWTNYILPHWTKDAEL